MGILTRKGYQLKTQNEYFSDQEGLYKAIDPEWELDPSTPDGLKIAHDAEVFTALDEAVLQSYQARDPNQATGYDLDVLGALTGAKRSLGTPSTVELKITGVAGTVIPKGSEVKTNDGIVFLTDETVTIDLDGVVEVNAHCNVNGAISVSSNTLTNIVKTIGGWQSVTNPKPATTGTNRDSDAIFRIKRARAVGRAGQNQKESLFGEIYEVEGVRKVAIYENKTDSSSVDQVKNPHGLPPHSLAIVVDGGDDTEVARAIYKKVSVGVNLHAVGTKVEKQIFSKIYKQSYDNIIYSRPTPVEISIRVTLADPKQVLPSQEDTQEMVRQAFIDYYAGELIPDGIGFKDEGFDIGEIVPYSRMYTPVNKVTGDYEGVYVKDLKLNGGTANVEVAYNQLASFAKERITVKVRLK